MSGSEELSRLLETVNELREAVMTQAEHIAALESRVAVGAEQAEPGKQEPEHRRVRLASFAEAESVLFPLARELSDAYDFDGSIRYPRDLASHEALREGAHLLAQSELSDKALLGFIGRGEHVMFGPMATEALRVRGASLVSEVCERLGELEERGLHFALEYIASLPPQGALGDVFRQASLWWLGNPLVCESLQSFAKRELARGGVPVLTYELHQQLESVAPVLIKLFDELGIEELFSWRDGLSRPPVQELDTAFLGQVGRLWTIEDMDDVLFVEQEEHRRLLRRLEAFVTGGSRRSAIVLGKHGVGKTATLQQLFRRLLEAGWSVFEASAADVLAGQRYVGELEGRVQKLLDALRAPRKVVWYIPDFHELLDKGATQQDPTGILDLLLPAIERQKVTVLGETRPDPYARLLRARHKLRYALESMTMEESDLRMTVEMAHAWADEMSRREGQPIVAPGVIEEAVQLSLQYLAERSLPGSLMQLVERAFLQHKLGLDDDESFPLTSKDLLGTISHLTHLPSKVLDDREKLDIEALREHFRQYVIGQDEAVECLVERIAMIKAGLTDPSRPLGVFFFAGPTGTGKTELAKTLCRFLFGTEQNMLRLDMSEYNDRDSYWRLIQDGDAAKQSRSLASQIREQPFSVVLLDEVEKAHPQIWDLFLQVFDDGRLTDQSGDTVDFRHSMIILTSNIGSTIPTGTGVGFNANQQTFAATSVEKAIETTFRREFVNRLDRIVVFNPLTRGVMRDILHKELNGLLQRRGFRSRDWAVEWGASAVDFLLEEGFTPDLGARPLKRAIERFLLAPLAKTIVEHRFPEGNQFLFVSSDGHQIQVRFIDPDLVKSEGEEAVLSAEPERDLSLKWVAFSGEGTEEELLFVEQRWSALVAQTSGSLWRNEKGTVQGRINDEGFIRAPDRYRILEKLECMERIEAGVDAAGKLWNRIRGAAELRTQVESMRRLAQQLLLLELAARDVMRDTPQNALLHIVGLPSGELPKEASFDVFQHIKGMYQSWGERRRMRSMWLRRGSLADMQAILAVSGLGAWSILREEQGLHVFALPREDGTFHLTRVRVQVSPQPTQQVGSNQSVLTYATDYFSQQEAASETICRHYRWAPSPQVHDRVLGWKTEEIGRILAGDFDLVEGDN